MSEDVGAFAGLVASDEEWIDNADEWGNEFQNLLKAFHETLSESTSAFLRSAKSQAHVDTFAATHPAIQAKLAVLLQFTYDWNTRMGSSANK